MATAPDSWNDIVDRALAREPAGSLPADFALRIERAWVPDRAAARVGRVWIWLVAWACMVAPLVVWNAIVARAAYEQLLSEVVTLVGAARLDLLAVALLSLALTELLARRRARAGTGATSP